MINSADWGERFYNEFVPPLLKTLFASLTENSEYPLQQLDVKEDSKTRWVAYFHSNLKDGSKYFAYSKDAILNKNPIHLNGEKADRYRQLNAIMNLLRIPCHEFHHFEQEYMQEQRSIIGMDPKAIIYAKESVLSREAYNFYSQFHEQFLSETDADINSFIECLNLFEKINISSSAAKKICDSYKYYLEEYKIRMKNYMAKGGFCEQVSQRVDKIVKMMDDETRKMYLKKCPVLNIIYKNNGDKRTYNEIMELKKRDKLLYKNQLNDKIRVGGEEVAVSTNIDRVYDVIIKTDKELRKQQEDSYLAIERERKPEKHDVENKEEKKNYSFFRGR